MPPASPAWTRRPHSLYLAQSVVDTDLGALADQMHRCTGPARPVQQMQWRAQAALGFVHRHLVTITVSVAVIAAGSSLPF